MNTRQRRIHEAVDRLASKAWLRRDIPGELERVDEIRLLVREQLADDVYSVTGTGRMDRVGRQVVHHRNLENTDFYKELWPAYSDAQQAVRAGLEPFIEQLEGEERLLIRWRYYGGLSLREIAAITYLDKMTVMRRLRAVHQKLRTTLSVAFLVGGG